MQSRVWAAAAILGCLMFSAAASADDAIPICADRPTKSFNACTADPGSWQLETDLFNGTFARSGGTTADLYLVTNPTFKYGVAQNWDVEASIAPYEILRVHDAFGSQTISGIGDLFLRVKYDAIPQGNVQLGFIPYLKLPTARDGLGNGAAETGISVPVNITLSDTWSLGFSPEFDALKDGFSSGRHFNTSQTVVVGYAMPDGFTVNAELWGDWNEDPAGSSEQYSLDFALAKALTNTLEIDGGVNIGLNRDTPDLQIYTGIATKF